MHDVDSNQGNTLPALHHGFDRNVSHAHIVRVIE
jgi:hypothetical protein